MTSRELTIKKITDLSNKVKHLGHVIGRLVGYVQNDAEAISNATDFNMHDLENMHDEAKSRFSDLLEQFRGLQFESQILVIESGVVSFFNELHEELRKKLPGEDKVLTPVLSDDEALLSKLYAATMRTFTKNPTIDPVHVFNDACERLKKPYRMSSDFTVTKVDI